MKIGFTGSSEGITVAQLQALRLCFALIGDDAEFHHGDCVGADETAHGLALTNGWSVIIHPPKDDRHRAFCEKAVTHWQPKAYLIRNRDIVACSDTLIACPKGPEERRSGTWSTVRYARKKIVKIIIVWPDGTVVQDGGTSVGTNWKGV